LTRSPYRGLESFPQKEFSTARFSNQNPCSKTLFPTSITYLNHLELWYKWNKRITPAWLKMVDKEIVLETVRKMYDSGIDDSVVEQTLKDIGLGPAEIKKYIAEAKGVSQGLEPAPKPEPKPLEQRKAAAEEKPDQAALHQTTHIALEEQSARTAELIGKLDALEKRLGAGPAASSEPLSASVNQRLAGLEKQMRDLKAELDATRAIMEKILETDRKVLTKL
jgi:hypothetical protein